MKKGNDPKYDCLLLDNQLCFPLYVCSKEIVNAYAPFLAKIDLTYTQYITMMVMWEEKKVLTRHLRERLFLDSGTLTPVINRLEEKGYVTKERSAEDARDLVVSITETGEKLKEEAVKVPGEIGSCLAGVKDPERLVRLGDLLHEMMDIFNENRKQKK
jgi:DNA-binding MarR family transcriptional regulator